MQKIINFTRVAQGLIKHKTVTNKWGQKSEVTDDTTTMDSIMAGVTIITSPNKAQDAAAESV